MQNNLEIDIINNEQKNQLYNNIKIIINKTFEKLNDKEKELVSKYLFYAVMLINVYFYSEHFIKQIMLNKNQDIYSIMVLLLPFYDLNKSKEMSSLNEILINSDNTSKALNSSYYIDHDQIFSDNYIKNVEEYLNNSLMGISMTLSKICNKLLPNWINIFPHTMTTIFENKLYLNFKEIYENKKFIDNQTLQLWKSDLTNNFELNQSEFMYLGYPTLYSTIYSFLYNDIKDIKWMIYDINYNNNIIPNIILITEELGISKICSQEYSKLDINRIKDLELKWKQFKTKSFQSLKALILFYLRWSQDNDYDMYLTLNTNNNLENINKNDYYENDIDDDIYTKQYDIDIIVKNISNSIPYERIYKYIYLCSQKFKYTWYGHQCLTELNIYYTTNDYKQNYKNKIITPKNIYNYFKSLINNNITDNGETRFRPITNSYNWYELTESNRKLFISRLNDRNIEWYNIRGNLSKIYDKNQVNEKQNEIREIIIQSELIPKVIFTTLVYNGLLSYYKYNPILSNSKLIPDKNKKYSDWNDYIMKHVDIKSYSDSYHFLSNQKLDNHDLVSMKNSKWYTNFGADWIAQIQLYHRHINNRILFITGATGAGKSTVAPFLLLYATKMIDFKNNGKVICTQPRKQPTKDNAIQISKNLGVPILFDSKGDATVKDINYIQYKFSDGAVTDDLYHPTLLLCTDGLLYNIIKTNYVMKKTNISDMQYTSNNLLDILLVDEAHEHNTYMDMILTLSKFPVYINNQISLGIISATMDNDEIIYRKYFEIIDDNYKYPLNTSYLNNNRQVLYDQNYIDRRIHLSIPFGGMNFKVDDIIQNAYSKDINVINEKVISIVKYILNDSVDGDILIFQPGQNEIIKLIETINKVVPNNVLAIPFYSKLDPEILENKVKKISNPQIRNSIRYPKKYTIEDIVPSNELLKEPYTRFIIIATNIAEASITIDTLKYVIDTGTQKVLTYDVNTNQDILETRLIAIPNQKQRRGRIGRVKPGTAYYTYDITQISENVVYKICIENITEKILDLISSSNINLINSYNDPNSSSSLPDIPFLYKQYSIINGNNVIKFNRKYRKHNLKIIYPQQDGKYKLEYIRDELGQFYIIHPDEDKFTRNTNLEIIKRSDNYKNKIDIILKYCKNSGYLDSNDKLNNFGSLISGVADLMLLPIQTTRIILDIIASFPKNTSLNDIIESQLTRYGILFLVFRSLPIKTSTINNYTGYADFLILSKLVPNQFYKQYDIIYNIQYIASSNGSEIDNELYIQNKVEKLLRNNYSIEIRKEYTNIKNILLAYYTYLYKIFLVMINNYVDGDILFKDLNIKLKLIKEEKNASYMESMKQFKTILFGDIKQESLKFGNHIYIPVNTLIEKTKSNRNFKILNLNKLVQDNNTNNFIKEQSNNPNAVLNLEYNKRYDEFVYEKLEGATTYDKFCFYLIVNYPNNVLIKIDTTDTYIEYFNRDINLLYKIKEYGGTRLPNDITNKMIFAIESDSGKISNLLVIREYIFNILLEYYRYNNINIMKRNSKLNVEQCKETYGYDFNYMYLHYKKILEYIEDNNN